jgi:hypothetical protein
LNERNFSSRLVRIHTHGGVAGLVTAAPMPFNVSAQSEVIRRDKAEQQYEADRRISLD